MRGSTTTLFIADAALSPSRMGGVTAVVFRNHHAAAIRVEENFGGVEPHPLGGIGRSLDPIAVDLPRLHARHEHVPVMVGAVG